VALQCLGGEAAEVLGATAGPLFGSEGFDGVTQDALSELPGVGGEGGVGEVGVSLAEEAVGLGVKAAGGFGNEWVAALVAAV